MDGPVGNDGAANMSPSGSGFRPRDSGDAPMMDGEGEYAIPAAPSVDPELCPSENIVSPGCLDALESEAAARLCDGFDNDCDGQIDEGCPCKQGEVKRCFDGPPGRIDVGACVPGTMRCIGSGDDTLWGGCDGGISPSVEICDGLDNDCNGCTDEVGLCDGDFACPAPGDARIPSTVPFQSYALQGGIFYAGDAMAWSWTIEGGPCDNFGVGQQSFDLLGANQEDATFIPRLSGSYRVTLTVTTIDGPIQCSWVVDVLGPGVRIEMCYPESNTQDLDLLVMQTSVAEPWYGPNSGPFNPNENACSWWNCEAMLRQDHLFRYPSNGRANWGYADSQLENCVNGPQGEQWRSYGACANPRLDIDNNLSEGTGLPENINIDQPRNGDGYRIMIHNFTGTRARPLVNIYCGGELKATFGAAPDELRNFAGTPGNAGLGFSADVGAMWRVADVTAVVDESGDITDCTVEALHPPGSPTGYDISQNDRRF